MQGKPRPFGLLSSCRLGAAPAQPAAGASATCAATNNKPTKRGNAVAGTKKERTKEKKKKKNKADETMEEAREKEAHLCGAFNGFGQIVNFDSHLVQLERRS